RRARRRHLDLPLVWCSLSEPGRVTPEKSISLYGVASTACFSMSALIDPDPAFFFLLNASVIASFAVLPALVLGYVTSWTKARRIGPLFSLGKLESIEMDRAILLYGRVSDRLQEIQHTCSQVSAGLLARYQHRSRLKRQFADEEKDLQDYAAHLRTTIA